MGFILQQIDMLYQIFFYSTQYYTSGKDNPPTYFHKSGNKFISNLWEIMLISMFFVTGKKKKYAGLTQRIEKRESQNYFVFKEESIIVNYKSYQNLIDYIIIRTIFSLIEESVYISSKSNVNEKYQTFNKSSHISNPSPQKK